MKKLRGSSSLEMIMIMTLLILFVASAYTMIYAGVTAQEHITSEKQTQMDTRVVTSYLNVKLKQNDIANKVTVVTNPIDNKNAICIRDAFNDGTYNTWIYYEDGKLVEQFVEVGKTPELDLGFEIGLLDDFQVEMDNNMIKTTISYTMDDKKISTDSIYTFKSIQN